MEEENRGMDNQMTYVLWFRQVSLLKLLSNFTFLGKLTYFFRQRRAMHCDNCYWASPDQQKIYILWVIVQCVRCMFCIKWMSWVFDTWSDQCWMLFAQAADRGIKSYWSFQLVAWCDTIIADAWLHVSGNSAARVEATWCKEEGSSTDC